MPCKVVRFTRVTNIHIRQSDERYCLITCSYLNRHSKMCELGFNQLGIHQPVVYHINGYLRTIECRMAVEVGVKDANS